jgi:hypothetical protein
MKRTFTGTLFNPNLAEAKVELNIFNRNKYTDEKPMEVRKFRGMKSWTVFTEQEGLDIEEDLDIESEQQDVCHEYLEIEMEDGRTEWFNNTAVAMFVF